MKKLILPVIAILLMPLFVSCAAGGFIPMIHDALSPDTTVDTEAPARETEPPLIPGIDDPDDDPVDDDGGGDDDGGEGDGDNTDADGETTAPETTAADPVTSDTGEPAQSGTTDITTAPEAGTGTSPV